MAKPPPSQISVRIVKNVPYRGDTREWSNRYFWNQTALPSQSDRDAIVAALLVKEKPLCASRVHWLRAIWYAAGSDVPVYEQTLTGSGTMSEAGTDETPGDCATLIRFSTTQRTSKNHPIYLFKYYHDAHIANGGDPDSVVTVQHQNLDAMGQLLVDGISQGGTTYKLAGPYGAVAQGYVASTKITHRDFPR